MSIPRELLHDSEAHPGVPGQQLLSVPVQEIATLRDGPPVVLANLTLPPNGGSYMLEDLCGEQLDLELEFELPEAAARAVREAAASAGAAGAGAAEFESEADSDSAAPDHAADPGPAAASASSGPNPDAAAGPFGVRVLVSDDGREATSVWLQLGQKECPPMQPMDQSYGSTAATGASGRGGPSWRGEGCTPYRLPAATVANDLRYASLAQDTDRSVHAGPLRLGALGSGSPFILAQGARAGGGGPDCSGVGSRPGEAPAPGPGPALAPSPHPPAPLTTATHRRLFKK